MQASERLSLLPRSGSGRGFGSGWKGVGTKIEGGEERVWGEGRSEGPQATVLRMGAMEMGGG